MVARIGYLAENFGGFSPEMQVTARNLMHASGFNVGNFAFWNAAHGLVAGEKTLVPFGAKAEQFKGKIDSLIIPAANWLNQRQDFGWLADLVDGLDVPCVVLGLGAQADSDDEYPLLREGSVRLLKALSQRTPFLGVRGEYSARVCRHYGIDNVEALGCPSILTVSTTDLGRRIAAKWLLPADKVAFHTLNIKPGSRTAEAFLFEALKSGAGSLIIQAPREFVALMTREDENEGTRDYLSNANRLLGTGLSDADFIQFMRGVGYVPFSVDSWINFLNYFSHSLNTRIHGTIMSLMAAVPSVCFLHDTRTRELCEIMGIPSVEADAAARFERVSDVFSAIAFDAEQFDENRHRLARRNAELLIEAGFDVSEKLRCLA